MRVIPVIDVRSGQAVHARAGARAHYRPVQSVLHEGSSPIGLAQAYRRVLGLDELYVADLDAIAGAPVNLDLFRTLRADGFTLWVDAGLRQSAPAGLAEVATLVAGLETLEGASALRSLVRLVGADRLVFSLDMREGRPLLAAGSRWSTHDAMSVAEEAIGLGVRRLLLLDLVRIGGGTGTGTTALLAQLVSSYPTCEFTAGGGVAGLDDLRALQAAGANAVLVASALHNGRIGRVEIEALRDGQA
jgi:phosphoribosylformimino-5-aminoimidazole carboxamide ribotide isomerase